ncbi:hypothetical protein ACWCRD_33795 [Streptomyces sp. NPDC002092]
MGLISVDSATSRAHHHAAGMILDAEQLAALEAAVESEKGAPRRNRSRERDSPAPTAALNGAGPTDGTAPA